MMIPLKYLENPMINGILKIFLVFYAGAIAPKLPQFISKLFQNSIIKMIVLFLISYVGIKDPVMSLMIAVGFTLTMLSLNKIETIKDVHDLLDAVIDVPQEILNDIVDGAQDLIEEGAKQVDKITEKVGIKMAEPIVDIANEAIDKVQEISNNIIDGTQEIASELVGAIIPKEEEEKKEEEKKEEMTIKLPIVMEEELMKEEEKKEEIVEEKVEEEKEEEVDFEMGTLGDIQGYEEL